MTIIKTEPQSLEWFLENYDNIICITYHPPTETDPFPYWVYELEDNK